MIEIILTSNRPGRFVTESHKVNFDDDSFLNSFEETTAFGNLENHNISATFGNLANHNISRVDNLVATFGNLAIDHSNLKDNSTSDNSTGQICHPNMVAICQTKPEIVTVTEQRQLCTNEKNEKNFATTKICITYKDGSWYCKNLVNIKY